MTELDPSSLLAVFTTTVSREDGRRIASALVERGLVACAQLSDIESLYRWKGSLQQERECQLMLKTTVARYAEVEAAIRELHGYELPAVFAVPVTQAFESYATWVREETT